MGTIASIICSNPKQLTSEFVKSIIDDYTKYKYSAWVKTDNLNFKIGAYYTISEERFIEILSMLKEKYNIEIIEKIWWEFKQIKQ